MTWQPPAPPPPPPLAPPPPSPAPRRNGLLLAAIAGIALLGGGTAAAAFFVARSASKPSAQSTATAVPATATGQPAATPSPTPAGPFTDPNGRFIIQFPAGPVPQRQDTDKQINGITVHLTEWGQTLDVNQVYVVATAVFPDQVDVSRPHDNLDGAVKGSLNSTHGGTLVSETFGTAAGWPSVDAVLSTNGGYIAIRDVLAKHTLVTVLGTSLDNPPAAFAGFEASLIVTNPQ